MSRPRTAVLVPLWALAIGLGLLLFIGLRAQPVQAPVMFPITTITQPSPAQAVEGSKPNPSPASPLAPAVQPAPQGTAPRVVDPEDQGSASCGVPVKGIVRPQCATAK